MNTKTIIISVLIGYFIACHLVVKAGKHVFNTVNKRQEALFRYE